MTALLKFRDVCFGFAHRSIVEGLSFSLEPGTSTALVGPNGVGKTTLLRLASGSLAPASGEILFDQIPLSAMAPKQRAQHIALVPQQLEMPFDFTVLQIVEQGRTPYRGFLSGLSREDRMAVDRALDYVNISNLRHRIFNELSGGERQCVKIALGLAQQPRLLLLDEPTQNLDIGRQVEVIDLLGSLLTQGITMLTSIHDLHLIPGNFSSLILLSPDHSVSIGATEEILTPFHLGHAFNCPPGRHPLMMQELR